MKITKEKSHHTTVRFKEKNHAWLEKQARTNKVSLSKVVNAVVEEKRTTKP